MRSSIYNLEFKEYEPYGTITEAVVVAKTILEAKEMFSNYLNSKFPLERVEVIRLGGASCKTLNQVVLYKQTVPGEHY